MKEAGVEASEGPNAGCPSLDETMKLNGLWVALVWGLAALGCSAAPDEAQAGDTDVQSSEQELTANVLTKKQASTVLKLVDDICGDSWCEGDHNFHFDSIECTRPCGHAPGSCRLAFRLFPYDSDLKTGPIYARQCKTNGFTGFASLVDTAKDGAQSLNFQYYDALSTCIDDVERQLPPT